MDIQQQFSEAVADSKSLDNKPSNDILLKLYALFKQGTLGNTVADATPNPFDFVSKFKHEAWAKLNGMSQQDAMQQYVDLVKELKAQ